MKCNMKDCMNLDIMEGQEPKNTETLKQTLSNCTHPARKVTEGLTIVRANLRSLSWKIQVYI